ncbi:MAG: hypothetical protein B7Y00_01250 [Sphingomonadales bacterium 17-56-6]|nr:MAG: hypothetical protein B7Y00_01250 [Sphingomonadales bacterium 17-56-6]
MLTLKQRDLLHYIDVTLSETGIAPSFEEMKEALGLSSKSGVQRLLTGLTERGFVRRLANRSRALEVIRHSLDQRPNPEPAQSLNLGSTISVPLLRSGADVADYCQGRDIAMAAVPAVLVGAGEHFAAIMPDRSMLPNGILAGDRVLFRKVEQVDDHAVGLLALANGQVCIRSVSKDGSNLRLDAGDASIPTRWIEHSQVVIAGAIAGVVRVYA